jgi:hypothetical protein
MYGYILTESGMPFVNMELSEYVEEFCENFASNVQQLFRSQWLPNWPV